MKGPAASDQSSSRHADDYRGDNNIAREANRLEVSVVIKFPRTAGKLLYVHSPNVGCRFGVVFWVTPNKIWTPAVESARAWDSSLKISEGKAVLELQHRRRPFWIKEDTAPH